MRNCFFAFILSMVLVLPVSISVAAEPLQIMYISPSGEDVPAARQIVIQFNQPVVPIGRMARSRQEIPVTISPTVECQWRWLDRSSLACQLNEKEVLHKSTQYIMTVWPGIRTQDGETTKEPHVHKFITERIKISRLWFANWMAPGLPVIKIIFNQRVDKDSLERHLYFQYQSDRYSIIAEVDPGMTQPSSREDKPDQVQNSNVDAQRVWLIKPQRELSLDSKIELKVEPGLVSPSGKVASNLIRTALTFDTFPEFRFKGLTCKDNQNKTLLIGINPSAEIVRCNPLSRIALNFSAPVLDSQIKDKLSITPDLAGGRKDYDPWAGQNDYSRLGYPHQKGRNYSVWLPERLKAAQDYIISSKSGMKVADEFGRELAQPLEQKFVTDHRKPDFKLVHRQSVLESGTDSELPVYVTNLKQLKIDYRTLSAQGRSKDHHLDMKVPDAMDISFAMPMAVRKMLGSKSGAVYGKINSDPKVKKTTVDRQFFSQVTPFQVYVKMGHFNSLVWVTGLATGKSVKDATVTLYQDSVAALTGNALEKSVTTTDESGIALLAGTKTLDPELKTFGWRCLKDHCPRLFVKIEKNGEMALLPLNRDFEINSYRASGYSVFSRQRKQFGHIHSWGTTAQGVYRAGETVEYKLYVRDQNNQTFITAPVKGYQLELIDPSGKAVHTVKNIQLSKFGGFNSTFKIPETALIGWYRFRLTSDFSDYEWLPMKVLVSDFTPSSFKVRNELNGDIFHPGNELEILTMATLHSGGPYTDAQARVNVLLQAGYFSSDHALARGFQFDSYQKRSEQMVLQQTGPLNDRGENNVSVKLGESNIVFGKLRVESSVRDDRGKYIATATTADYVSVDRLVGLKSSKWLFEKDQEAMVGFIVVDAEGNPVKGTKVKLDIEREETVSARVKGAGNAYMTRYKSQWVSTGSCQGESTLEALDCRFVPEQPGTYRIIAKIEDTLGRPHQSEIKVWVAGKGRVNWSLPNDNSLQIIPEQKEYNVGDTARYLIKNPYPGANALVTLERYGVMKQWVMKLEQSTPVIEFPVDRSLLPGFYLSVVVMSPRVAPAKEAGQIDLGKPAYKLGYVKVLIKDPEKQIEVTVNTGAEVYKPGDKVTATLHAKAINADPGQAIELAVVVLDEAVLDLITGGKNYFDPYRGFYKLQGLDLQNYSLIQRLVGRQKFEKKGANAGGDGGGALSMRSDFRYVSYWNPALETDENGRAEIDFILPDNLTGWRILVMAVTPEEKMGLGHHGFKVSQPTEIRPVMPNQITEGDSFQAGFSIMNRTEKERKLTVSLSAKGVIDEPLETTREISLDPYKRQTIYQEIQTSRIKPTRLFKNGAIDFTIKAYDDVDGDAMAFQLPVLKQRVLETSAEYGSTTAENIQETILVPQSIYPDVGHISVELSPSVIGNLAGAFRYMRDYPYSCWEQKLSKGVMASHYQNLKPWLPNNLEWPGNVELPKKILQQAADYQAPNGGMTYYQPQDNYVSPYLSAYTALAFNWLSESGYLIPVQVEQKLHRYLEKMLRKDIVPGFYNKGMASTVRAVALAALSRHGKITLTDIQRYQSHVPYMSLFGKANFLLAALSVKGAEDIAGQLKDEIYAQAQHSGGKIAFNEELEQGYSRILATPLRTNCAILSSLLKTPAISDHELPFKLARTISLSRGRRDHWENTQENLFCMNALIDYSRIYESENPKMTVSVDLNDTELGAVEYDNFKNETVTLSRLLRAEDAGKEQIVSINKQGQGRVYHATQLQYALLKPDTGPVNAGVDIRREYSVEDNGSWKLLDSGDEFSSNLATIRQGDLVRVDLFVSLPAAANFVVVEDRVPGGLEPVNRDLATASEVDADKGDNTMAEASWWYQFDDWQTYNVTRWSFYHREIKHDTVRFYSDYLPPGRYHLSYTAQAIASGKFSRMPVHAEEMYNPDIFGKGRTGTLIVVDN